MSSFFEDIFSKHQCGFRKGFNTQQCLLTLLEKWKNVVDKGKTFSALLADLSEAFDCLNHEFLIAKVNAYSFTLPAFILIHNYISNRKQRVQVNNSCSLWQDILFGVSQGSFLGLPLFNIFLADLFLTLNNTEIATNYGDDTTPYAFCDIMDDLISALEKSSKIYLNGLMIISRKVNLISVTYLLVSSCEKMKIEIGDFQIVNSTCKRLSRVHFDNRLAFDYHISGL